MLYKLAVGAGARIDLHTAVESIRQGDPGPSVVLAGGEVITADIVIGADGVRSCVRDAIDVAQPKPFQADECKLNANQTGATQTLKKF